MPVLPPGPPKPTISPGIPAPKTGPSQPPPPRPMRNPFGGIGPGLGTAMLGIGGATAPTPRPAGQPTGTNQANMLAGRGTRLEMVAPGVWVSQPTAPSPTARWDRMTVSGGVVTRGLYGSANATPRTDFLAPVAPGVWSMVNLAQLNAAALATPDVPLQDSGGGGGGGGSRGYGGYGGSVADRYGFALGLFNWRIG